MVSLRARPRSKVVLAHRMMESTLGNSYLWFNAVQLPSSPHYATNVGCSLKSSRHYMVREGHKQMRRDENNSSIRREL